MLERVPPPTAASHGGHLGNRRRSRSSSMPAARVRIEVRVLPPPRRCLATPEPPTGSFKCPSAPTGGVGHDRSAKPSRLGHASTCSAERTPPTLALPHQTPLRDTSTAPLRTINAQPRCTRLSRASPSPATTSVRQPAVVHLTPSRCDHPALRHNRSIRYDEDPDDQHHHRHLLLCSLSLQAARTTGTPDRPNSGHLTGRLSRNQHRSPES